MRLAILICGLLFFTPIAFAEEDEEADEAPPSKGVTKTAVQSPA